MKSLIIREHHNQTNRWLVLLWYYNAMVMNHFKITECTVEWPVDDSYHKRALVAIVLACNAGLCRRTGHLNLCL
jgi:hypothetical protein